MSTGFLSRWRLRPGERILWEGQPDVGAYTFAGSMLLIPFSILWAGFAFFWEGSVIALGAPPIELSGGRRGTGTITLGSPSPYGRAFGPAWFGSWWMGMGVGQALVAIRDPDRVFAILWEARRDAMREAFGSGGGGRQLR